MAEKVMEIYNNGNKKRQALINAKCLVENLLDRAEKVKEKEEKKKKKEDVNEKVSSLNKRTAAELYRDKSFRS